jgi:hypothetical protein
LGVFEFFWFRAFDLGSGRAFTLAVFTAALGAVGAVLVSVWFCAQP